MLSISRWRRLPSMTHNPIIKKHQRQVFSKVNASTYLSVSVGLVCHLQGWLSSLFVFFFFFNLSTSWLCSCTVQVKDCGPVIALTKERPDNEPVNGELQLKASQWLSMLGIGLNDIKEWTRHWDHGGQAFRKEVLFALYQSAVSQEEKQFKLTLKKGILPYCPLGNSYWWPPAAIFNRCWCDYGIVTWWCVCTVLGRRGWSLSFECCTFKDLLTDKLETCGIAERCVLRRIKKNGADPNSSWSLRERDSEAVTHKSCRTASQAWHGNE